ACGSRRERRCSPRLAACCVARATRPSKPPNEAAAGAARATPREKQWTQGGGGAKVPVIIDLR
ncbi:MAG: hypothetical protein WBK37_07630, partial [Kiritimatiellia bacterium]